MTLKSRTFTVTFILKIAILDSGGGISVSQTHLDFLYYIIIFDHVHVTIY